MYGELGLVALRSLKAAGGWNLGDFQSHYMASFGPCGTFVGYADGATKGTILNMLLRARDEENIINGRLTEASITDPNVKGFSRQLKGIIAKTLAAHPEVAPGSGAAADFISAAVTAEAKAAIRDITETASAALVDIATKLGDLASQPLGANDSQTNSLAKVVVVAAAYAGHSRFQHLVAESITATANTEDSVMWGTFAAHVIEAVVLGASIADAISACICHLHMPHRALAESALHAGKEDAVDGGKAVSAGEVEARIKGFGHGCALSSGIPIALYLATRHGKGSSYAAAIKDNMGAGGDTTGRGTLLGALLAADYEGSADSGLPSEWLSKMTCKDDLFALTEGIHRPVSGEAVSEHVVHHGK